MSEGFSIDSLRGTPLYALAQNANVHGGNTLDESEMFAFQAQMKNLGWSPEQFGLAIETTDHTGETAKETRKNMLAAGKNLEKSYKTQFGKQGAEAAKTAEQRADAKVGTAYKMFSSLHEGVNFVPESLGARPKYTNPEYLDDVVRYASDLMNWANTVEQEYISATHMSAEQLTALVMQNNNDNKNELSAKMDANTEQLSNQMDEGFDKVNDNVDAAANKVIANDNRNTNRVIANDNRNTNRVIANDNRNARIIMANDNRNAGIIMANDNRNAAIIMANDNSNTGYIVSNNNINTDYIVANDNNNTQDIKNTVEHDGDKTRSKIDDESKKVQKLIQEKGDQVIDTLDPLYVKRAVKGVRDMAVNAGKSVAEFIADNPGLLIGGIPVGILAARGLLNK